MSDPKLRFYPAGSPAYKIIRVVKYGSMLLALLTLYFVIAAWRSRNPLPVYIFAAVWAIAPPVWFWFEYFKVYRKYGNPDTLELFKYGQQVAIGIWAAIALTLFAVSSTEHFKTPKSDNGVVAPAQSNNSFNPTPR
jgi:hypothetical protein